MSSSWNRSPSTRQVAPRPRPKPVKANKMYGWSDDEYVEGESPRSDGGDNVEHLPAREHVVPNEAKGWYRGLDNRWRRARITTTPVLTVKLDHKGQVVHAKSSAERLAMLKSKLLSGGKTAEGKDEEEEAPVEAAAAAAVSNNEQGVRDLSEGREADTDDTPKASRIKVSVDKRKTRSSTIDEVDGEESRKRRRAGEENKKEEELQVEDKKADDGRSPKRKTSGSPRKEGSSSPSVEARQRQLRAKLLGSKRNSDDGGGAG
ncbi:hypothetical protein Pmar_PMAR003887 [Perkinsus marinus ATCC 50983]|uniref:Uncharacterized protein n=1 Tax=Perkinsus marinus (strain ATCC 50983 / TXsc) TaxID=423536 RepID=C5L422_PERM5|nr:hypothetical protein Pmar_PMAR003887 [Perkinsus marinus ATCC 50983]EER08520.1 hypothetical protein Pmar_PMAR003887 [Perkinsus marinus ATCC 50983]|eukprot:XP_002776704.1 hypothetical protein Pmar_PMAR003887 [Perkinsus marinus ATCC 50983]